MSDCPYRDGVECTGPPVGEKWWSCPVHKSKLTPHWTKLCRSDRKFFDRWDSGLGPGSSIEGRPVITRPSRRSPMWASREGDVGTELAKIAPYIDEYKRNGCGDGTYAGQMDRMGLKRCREHFDTLIEWMRTAADASGVVFVEIDAKIALLRSITRAEMKLSRG